MADADFAEGMLVLNRAQRRNAALYLDRLSKLDDTVAHGNHIVIAVMSGEDTIRQVDLGWTEWQIAVEALRKDAVDALLRLGIGVSGR